MNFDILNVAVPILFLGLVVALAMYLKQREIAREAIERHSSVLESYRNMRNNYRDILKAQKRVESIRKQFNVHLANNIPTNGSNVGNVHKLNRLMKKSKSLYKLEIKYRGPKVKGSGYRGGCIAKANSKHFSVYLRKRQ